MKSLIRFFIRYPVMVNLGLGITVLVGLLSFTQVRYTLDPSEDPHEIYVDLTYRGASPLEIEEWAISRIEENLRGIHGMQRFTSWARENRGRITVDLYEWADIDELLVEVENAVNRIADLPEQMERPVVYKQEMLNPTITIALTGEGPFSQKRDFARQIRDEWMIEGGLSNVKLLGVADEEIVIELNDARLSAYGLTMAEIAEAVRKANIDQSAGEVQVDHAHWQIRARNRATTAMQIDRIPVRTGPDGQRLLLGEIAEVREALEDRPYERTLNGKSSINLQVLTTQDEDLVATAAWVRDYVQSFNNAHEGMELTVVEDISGFVNERAASLWANGLGGLLLVLLILTLFLDKRIAFWVSLTIPLSLLGTFVLALAGYDLTINVVSIFGFILVLGMLVDTGVVVAENIYRHYVEFGKKPMSAARDGASEVAVPMTISLLTTATAFSLFFFLPGKPGAFFSEVSFVVIGSLAAALVVTFLFLPAKMTRSRVLSDQNRPTRLERLFTGALLGFRDRWFMPWVSRLTGPLRWVNLAGFLVLLLASVWLIRSGTLPVTFFPYLDDDIQLLRIEMVPGTPADTTMARLTHMEEAVWRVNDEWSSRRSDDRQVIQHVERVLGPGTHQGQLRVILLGGEQRGIPAFELNRAFRETVGEVPGTRYVRFLGATAEQRFGGLPVDISVTGEELDNIQEAAARLKAILDKRTDLVDVADTDQRGNPELHLELNRVGEQLGLTLQEVVAQVRAAFFGLEVQTVQRNREDVRIWIRFDPGKRDAFEDLAGFRIRTPRGELPLREIASIHPTSESLEIQRIDGRRAIRVDADLADPSLSAPGILGEIKREVLPAIASEVPGVRFFMEGQNREAGQVTEAMRAVAPVLVVLMLALIVINFQSFSQTFIVLLVLPFAFVGVAIGHVIHGVTMNIFSVIGMIALIGILINNLLVLITAYNDNLKEEMSVEEALDDAVRSRFRPILLTTLSTIAGLVPMIFMGGLASAFLQPPAIAIAYGLLFGLLISLILVPALLLLWNAVVLRLAGWFGLDETTAEEIEPAVRLKRHHQRSLS
ncbi:MAG: efflux RND transporter permease subunit [Balneolaceae bacterium]